MIGEQSTVISDQLARVVRFRAWDFAVGPKSNVRPGRSSIEKTQAQRGMRRSFAQITVVTRFYARKGDPMNMSIFARNRFRARPYIR